MDVIVILLLLVLVFGGGLGWYGSYRGWGWGGWSPLIGLLIVVVLLRALGVL
jgi:hypothetical protein